MTCSLFSNVEQSIFPSVVLYTVVLDIVIIYQFLRGTYFHEFCSNYQCIGANGISNTSRGNMPLSNSRNDLFFAMKYFFQNVLALEV